MEGLDLRDKKGNRIGIQDNGIVLITPHGESTHTYTFQEIIKLGERLKAYEDTGLTPEEIEKLKTFKAYFDELYGDGLEVANWHLNGDLEPLDSFIDSATEEI